MEITLQHSLPQFSQRQADACIGLADHRVGSQLVTVGRQCNQNLILNAIPARTETTRLASAEFERACSENHRFPDKNKTHQNRGLPVRRILSNNSR
jgi:hypothetical protein